MAAHNDTGKKGEDLALQYLKGKGYSILEKNWRSLKYEIDIIAKEKEIIVVVEVKTRATGSMVDPLLSVDVTKRRNLIKAANSYVMSKKVSNEVRFDIITVGMGGRNPEIQHIENAFYPTLRG